MSQNVPDIDRCSTFQSAGRWFSDQRWSPFNLNCGWFNHPFLLKLMLWLLPWLHLVVSLGFSHGFPSKIPSVPTEVRLWKLALRWASGSTPLGSWPRPRQRRSPWIRPASVPRTEEMFDGFSMGFLGFFPGFVPWCPMKFGKPDGV